MNSEYQEVLFGEFKPNFWEWLVTVQDSSQNSSQNSKNIWLGSRQSLNVLETRPQYSQLKLTHESRPEKAWNKMESMLICFFIMNIISFVQLNYAHTGQTIYKEYYFQILKRWRNAIRWKRSELWKPVSDFFTTITVERMSQT